MSKGAFDRLRKEYARLIKSPVEYIEAVPLASNILEWHYVIRGPKGSLYEGGVYHGKVVFPPQYPFKPPSIQMITPNGRFLTNTRLCLSMSDFHPESWNPLWSVASILNGLLSFMLETTPTAGSTETSDSMKREYAKRSMDENKKNVIFRKLFPQYLEENNGGGGGGGQQQEEEEKDEEKESKENRNASSTSTHDRIGSSSVAAPSTAASSSSIKQRRVLDDAAATTTSSVGAGAAAALAPTPPTVLKVFGGRLHIREDTIFDLLVLAIVITAIIFGGLYLL